jgi:uncharacterized protein Usg
VEDRKPDLFFFLPDDEILLQRKILCAQDLAEQIKEMKAAEKRWESQVKEGKVKSLTAKEAGYAIQLSNYSFLDVRPSTEHSKVMMMI